MPESTPYYPFDTSHQLPVTPSPLSNIQKEILLELAKSWRDGTKLKRGTYLSMGHNCLGYPARVRLNNSIIKIEGEVYVLHQVKIGQGAEGKVKVIEGLSGGKFHLVKILFGSGALAEKEALSDAGFSLGGTQRVSVDKSDVSANAYYTKYYITMPYFGCDLRTHLKKQVSLSGVQYADGRMKIAIEASWALAKFHLGLSFISGEGRMHRDIKPANMVLGATGVRLIDYGTSRKKPDTLIYLRKGTIPYFVRPMLNESEMISGVLFDMECMRRTLYGVLCDNPSSYEKNTIEQFENGFSSPGTDRKTYKKNGILTSELIQYYHLDAYLEKGYNLDEIRYATQDELKINDAMTLTAVLIAAQQKLASKKIDQIINDQTHALAASIVGAYFSTQADWKDNGDLILQDVFALSQNQWEQRAAYVLLGLGYCLNQALQHGLLCDVLNSDVSHQKKRAVACIFQRGLFSADTYARLNAHEAIPMLCIEAHYHDDEDKLNNLLFEESMVDALNVFTCYNQSASIKFNDFLKYPQSLQQLKETQNAEQIACLKGSLRNGMPYARGMEESNTSLIVSHPRAFEILRLGCAEGMALERLKAFLLKPSMIKSFNLLKSFSLTKTHLELMQKHAEVVSWLYPVIANIMYGSIARVVLSRNTSDAGAEEEAELIEQGALKQGVMLYMFLENTFYREALLFIYQNFVLSGLREERFFLNQLFPNRPFDDQHEVSQHITHSAEQFMYLASRLSLDDLLDCYQQNNAGVVWTTLNKYSERQVHDVLSFLKNKQKALGSSMDIQMDIQWKFLYKPNSPSNRLGQRYFLFKRLMFEIDKHLEIPNARINASRALVMLYLALDRIKTRLDDIKHQGKSFSDVDKRFNVMLKEMDDYFDFSGRGLKTFGLKNVFLNKLDDLFSCLECFITDEEVKAVLTMIKVEWSLFSYADAANLRDVKQAVIELKENLYVSEQNNNLNRVYAMP